MSSPDVDARVSIVVVRDREPAALYNPSPTMFQGFGDVAYRHISDPRPLPSARHYFFNCERIGQRAHKLLIDTASSGATVALIVRRMEPGIVGLVERMRINVIPMYGDADQISTNTLRRAVRTILTGGRMVARGFIRNSIGDHASTARGRHVFVDMLVEASVEANSSTGVVAAVLALQRTGSNFLRDIIGLSVSANVRIFHEHDVPNTSESLDATRPMFDQLSLETDHRKRRLLRRAILRDALLTPQRRYVFVSERNPEDRLVSYFVKSRSAWLHRCFDAARARFRNRAEIQSAFREWAWGQVDRQRKWYRSKLLRPFGLDILKTERIDGLLVGRKGPNTLLVVPTTALNRLRTVVSAEFATDCYQSLSDNSASESGDHAIDKAFREEILLDPVMTASLWTIPEVAHVHARETSRCYCPPPLTR